MKHIERYAKVNEHTFIQLSVHMLIYLPCMCRDVWCRTSQAQTPDNPVYNI